MLVEYFDDKEVFTKTEIKKVDPTVLVIDPNAKITNAAIRDSYLAIEGAIIRGTTVEKLALEEIRDSMIEAEGRRVVNGLKYGCGGLYKDDKTKRRLWVGCWPFVLNDKKYIYVNISHLAKVVKACRAKVRGILKVMGYWESDDDVKDEELEKALMDNNLLKSKWYLYEKKFKRGTCLPYCVWKDQIKLNE